ncbi:hypothetical protein [Priestia flexa]|uniref:hypothetical protein n=1 Tax=Priestia flexa TaxID=86664 RepID=UPI000473FEE4|nr:hypothetical protein [Priestia flexa]
MKLEYGDLIYMSSNSITHHYGYCSVLNINKDKIILLMDYNEIAEIDADKIEKTKLFLTHKYGGVKVEKWMI